jgi:hypothetical protein
MANEWVDLSRFPGLTHIRLKYSDFSEQSGDHEGRRVPNSLRDLQLRIVAEHDREQAVLVMDGKVKPEYAGVVTIDEDTNDIDIAKLAPNYSHALRYGTLQVRVTGNREHKRHENLREIPPPELTWDLEHLEDGAERLVPLLRFAEKTGWMRHWGATEVKPGEAWQLYGLNDPPSGSVVVDASRRVWNPRQADDGPPLRRRNWAGPHASFLVMQGRGRWPLVNYQDMPFKAPCLLGFIGVLPDSSVDHTRRSARWTRRWTKFHEDSLPEASNDPKERLQPWFIVGYPLLDHHGSAIADASPGATPTEVIELPYSRMTYAYRETFVDDGLHVDVRQLVGGNGRWDPFLGTLHEYGGRIFHSQHPTVLPAAGDVTWSPTPQSLRRPFGELALLATPVASTEALMHAYAGSQLVDRTQDDAVDAAQLPIGCLIVEGVFRRGLVVVPSGFAIIARVPPAGTLGTLPNVHDEPSPRVATVIAALRTPRLFGEFEAPGVAIHLPGGETRSVRAFASVFYFVDSNPEEEDCRRRPVRLQLAFTMPYDEIIARPKSDGRERIRHALLRRAMRALHAAWRDTFISSGAEPMKLAEWLFHEWYPTREPTGQDEAVPISMLLLSAVLKRGQPITEVNAKSALKYSSGGRARSPFHKLIKAGYLKSKNVDGDEYGVVRVTFAQHGEKSPWTRRTHEPTEKLPPDDFGTRGGAMRPISRPTQPPVDDADGDAPPPVRGEADPEAEEQSTG